MKINPSFYRISAEEDVFNRYYHKPLPGESVETYSAVEIYRRLKQKSPESMRNVSVGVNAQRIRPTSGTNLIGHRYRTHPYPLWQFISGGFTSFTVIC